jgi:hypothetical protein
MVFISGGQSMPPSESFRSGRGFKPTGNEVAAELLNVQKIGRKTP